MQDDARGVAVSVVLKTLGSRSIPSGSEWREGQSGKASTAISDSFEAVRVISRQWLESSSGRPPQDNAGRDH